MSIQQLSNQYLNSVNDASPGGSVTGTGASQYSGQLGHELSLDADQAAKLSNSTATLYAGKYKYVNVRSGASQSPARGQIAYWYDTSNNYIVTADVATGCVAGVFINAITKGNYGYIQTGGIASVLFKASVTKATPAACDLVVNVSDSSLGKGDVLADATNLTSVEVRAVIGTALVAPTSGAISTINLFERMQLPAQNVGN